ncbi:MAG: hypothetical protein ACC608_01115 [Anaerofustis sp.]
MNKYWILLKLQLKSTFNLRDLITSTKTNKKQMRKILLAVILIAAFAPSYWMYNALIQALFDNFSLINQQGAVIAAGVTVTGVVILFFGIMNVFSAFFGAKDLDMLLALPIHPRLIVASKLSGSIIAEYLFAVPLMLPIFINYGINIHAGILFWIIGMILTLTIPIIPLSIAAILSVLIVRIAGMRFDLDKIQMGFMLIFMAVILTLNFTLNKTMSSVPSGSEQDFLSQIITNNHYLIDLISATYPPAKLAANATVAYSELSGVVSLLLFLLTSAAAFFLAVVTGEKFYLGAVTRGLGGKHNEGKALSKEQLTLSVSKTSSTAISIFKNDFRVLLRTPVYAMNMLLTIPLVPVILIFSLTSAQQGNISSMQIFYEQFSMQINVFACVGMVVLSSLSTLTTSTFSREGSAFWINQVAPIRALDQMLGRSLGAVIVNFLMVAALILSFGILIHVSLLNLIGIVFTSTVATFPVIEGALIVDLIHPFLTWSDPAKAIKQNINVLFCFLIALIHAALLTGISLLLMHAGLSAPIILSSLATVSLLLAFLLARLFLRLYPESIRF